MKKRILSILLLCCMVLTMLPAPAFAADEEAYALPPDTGGLCEHHPEHDEACGYTPQTEDAAGTPCGHVCEIRESGDSGADPAGPAGTSGDMMPMTLLGAVRPAATQFTYTLHYDANGGSGAPPSQSMTSSELYVQVPISEKIPTRDGYTFKGWAESPNGEPRYLREEGYYYDYLMVHPSLSETIYAIWEVHNHSWGEWTSNGNGTHKRTCNTDSSHTETDSCSGGKATGTEKAICETCHTAYGELLPLTKTVITTPPTLPSEGYVGDQYLDGDLKGGEAKAQGTDIIVPGSFRFKHNWGGVVGPGENRMEILFTPDDAETYATAECIVTVTGLKHTITGVIEEVLPDVPLGTAFEYLGLPFEVNVKTNTGDIFYFIPVTWDGSTYDPNARGEQIITGQLHVEESFYAEELEPTSTVKAIARITLIGDGAIVPTLEPPTYSRQIYSGDFCQLAFSDEYLSGGKATADGETVHGVFTLNEEQELYGYWRRDGGLVQVGPLALKVTFTPDDLQKYTTAECTVNVDVIPRKFRQANTSYIDNKKIGTAFEDLGLPNAFYFFAAADEPNHEGSGLNGNVPGIIKWDDSNYDPNSYEEQTIYGEVNRAEFEKYYIVPEGADLRGVIKVTLQADPAETEITQPPVFRWKNGDFTLPDNTMFVNRIFEMGATGGGSANLADGVARVKGTDTVVPGTFSFKEGTPGWFDKLGENVVTVVFTPTDQYGYRTAETTIKVNVIKNTFKRCEEPDPITEKKLGTTFAGLNLPQIVVVEAIDGLRVGMEVSWEESSYDAQSTAWQTIPGTLVFDANDEHRYQQPEPAVTAAIRVKLLGPEDAPAITTMTLPGGTVGTPYHHQLQATGGGFILWELFSGALPDGLTLKQTTGEISGTPTAEGTAQFTVQALNSVGNDKKELSITIANTPAVEHTVNITTDGGGTASADPTTAAAGTEITLTASPSENYHFKQWQVEAPAGLVIANDKFTMPDSDVEIKAVFEKDAPSAEDLVDPVIRIHLSPLGGGYYAIENGENCTRTAADFFQPGKVPEGAKITAVTPPPSPSIPVSVNVDSDGTLSCTKTETTTEIAFKSEIYTVTITSDDYAPITAPLTVRQYLNAGFEGPIQFQNRVYGDTYTYTCQVTNPGENGVWSALIRDPEIFEIYQETTDITSEPGKSIYTVQIRAIKASARVTWIDFLYFSDTTMASTKDSGSAFTGGAVSTRPLTVTAGSATITKGDALPTGLVSCTGLLESEGRTDDRDTVLDNALGYQLLDANNEEVTAEAARNTPGTYTVVPAAALKSGWDERYSLNRVNGTLTVEDKVEELFTVTVTSGGNGTVSASHVKAVADTEITLTATPDKGYHFKEWQVISGGVTIKDDKFTMPSANVEVKAIFEKDAPPAPTEFIVTFDGNGGTPSVDSMTTTNQKLTSLPSASRSGSYSFDGWYTEKSGGTKITTDTVFHAGTTVYAHWTYTGGGSSNYSYYTIKATAGTGGSITPSGNVSVREGRDKTFTITPDKGYTVSNVKIDGRSIGAVKSYTFENVKRAHTIEVSFTRANEFIDVPLDSYFFEAVMWAVENGVTTGISASRFDPNGICTRAQAVTFLWRAAGSPKPETRTMPFTDVPAGSYYYDAVLWAIENGITKGTSNTTFSPNDTCTRAQIVSFLWRSEKTPVASSRNLFTDVKPGAYYLDAVLWAVESGITKGTTAMKFSPDADCTRAQIVTFLWRCKK